MYRKVVSRKSDKVSELVQDECNEVLDKNFANVFASQVQHLVVRKVSVELNGDKVEFDMHEGNKVGISDSGELSRNKDNVLVSEFSEWIELMIKLRDVVNISNLTLLNEKTRVGFTGTSTSSNELF